MVVVDVVDVVESDEDHVVDLEAEVDAVVVDFAVVNLDKKDVFDLVVVEIDFVL